MPCKRYHYDFYDYILLYHPFYVPQKYIFQVDLNHLNEISSHVRVDYSI